MIVSLQDYRRITRDMKTPDGDVTRVLAAAQQSAERFCHRHFDAQSRTEQMKIHANGRCIPYAYPVVSVSAPDGAAIEGEDAIYPHGYSEWMDSNMLINRADMEFYDRYIPYAQVTYVGGYTVDTAPEELKRILCIIAKASMPSNILVDVPVGTTSISIGDISISGRDFGASGGVGFGATAYLSPDIRAQLEEWRRPR